jgi:hypothetical protein
MDKFVLSLPRGNGKRKASPGRSAKPAKLTKGESSRGTQMFLDLGQKMFGATKQCQKCNMIYILGDMDDEKRHKSFCEQSQRRLMVKGTVDQKQVVETFQNGLGICGEDQVLLLRGVHSSKQKIDSGSLSQILHTVQNALGSTLDLMESTDESCLLYLRGKEVLGCVVVEPVSTKALIPISKTMKTTDVNVKVEDPEMVQPKPIRKFGKASANVVTPVVDNKHSSVLSLANTKREASLASGKTTAKGDNPCEMPGEEETLGVKLVWVGDDVRRMGVAGKLVDSARKHFRFGTIIRREHVAFSQPTDQGLAFALSFTGKDCIWGYC